LQEFNYLCEIWSELSYKINPSKERLHILFVMREWQLQKKKYLLKLGLRNTGAWEMSLFVLLKAPFFSSSHLKYASLQNFLCKGVKP
jgi:hypothetical protein